MGETGVILPLLKKYVNSFFLISFSFFLIILFPRYKTAGKSNPLSLPRSYKTP
jgi:hypothetical protein